MSRISKSSTLAKRVTLKIGEMVPLLAEYPLPNDGYLGFFLAPKLPDEELKEHTVNMKKELGLPCI
jgi:hypothetical protein